MPVAFQTNDDAVVATAMAALAGFGLCIAAVLMVVFTLVIAGLWKMFAKAGRPGWAAIVPFYGDMIRNEIAGVPVVWTYYTWIILAINMFTGGLAGFGPMIILALQYFTYRPLLKAYGRDNGTGSVLIALFFPYIVFPQIGFGSNTYLGPQADAVANLPDLPWINNATPNPSAPSVGTPINTSPPVTTIPTMTQATDQPPADNTPPSATPPIKGYADDDINKPQSSAIPPMKGYADDDLNKPR